MANASTSSFPAGLIQTGSKALANGSLGQAVGCFEEMLNSTGRGAEYCFQVADLLANYGHFAEAGRYYEEGLAKTPNVHAYGNLGIILTQLGQEEPAIAALRKALAMDSSHADACFNLANLLADRHEYEEAKNLYMQAIRIRPGYYQAAANLALLFNLTGDKEKALKLAKQVTSVQPDFMPGWLYYGRILREGGEEKEATECFRRVIAAGNKDPNLYAEARIQLALSLEILNETEESAALLEQLSKEGRTNPTIAFVQAKLARRDNDLEKAGELIKKAINYLELRSDPSVEGHIYTEQSRIFEKLKQYDAAYLSASRAQKVYSSVAAIRNCSGESFMKIVQGCRKWADAQSKVHWPHEAHGAPAPIFLVGFPRSGTTLMEQILSAHPEVFTTNEEDIIYGLVSRSAELLQRNIAYPDDLQDWNTSTIEPLQRRYWDDAAALFGEEVRKKRLVDKQPFNFVHLPMILRLYPEARILMMIRDPRDVTLSCFMQSFNFNPAMANFYTLESACRLYHEAMGLYLRYKEILPLHILEVRYEELVQDVAPHARNILEFAGLEWNDNVLHYYSEENRRAVTTPSYEGVTKPAYTTSIQKWKPYQKHFEPHLHYLQPYLNIFGYSD